MYSIKTNEVILLLYDAHRNEVHAPLHKEQLSVSHPIKYQSHLAHLPFICKLKSLNCDKLEQ